MIILVSLPSRPPSPVSFSPPVRARSVSSRSTCSSAAESSVSAWSWFCVTSVTGVSFRLRSYTIEITVPFAHGVLRVEPAGSADVDAEEVEEPGLDADGFGDGGGVAVVGGDQAQVGEGLEDGPAGGSGGGGAVAGQAGH